MMGEFHGGLLGMHVVGWLFWIVLAGLATWLIVGGLFSGGGSTASAREAMDRRHAHGRTDAALVDDPKRQLEGGPDRGAT